MRAFLLVVVLLATIPTFSHADSIPNQIHSLRPHTAGGGHHIPGVNCLSWRLGVEANNIRDWAMVPQQCEEYVGHYMLGHQYRDDCIAVAISAVQYAKNATLAHDGKDIWVFDIEETTLSNLPYYARSDVAFGATAYNATKFDAWVSEGTAPAVPGGVRLYRTLVSLGIKPVFLSGTKQQFRKVRIANLKKTGYSHWEKLILKGANDTRTAVEYKSKKRTELVKKGYRIIGNIGDQWSDLLGDNAGARTFKLPDPMYYIA
ncbi:PREDICTED: acid phosphatase 1-like [Ipomoea nil]|uniref:acid phosphatase 1-like n=1 Tax=Ipomoea nil TaxID=35883 RepID=UPI0009008F0E|nr:PREDICTED: acid phosphatase 1-like [Ipomoea nil]